MGGFNLRLPLPRPNRITVCKEGKGVFIIIYFHFFFSKSFFFFFVSGKSNLSPKSSLA